MRRTTAAVTALLALTWIPGCTSWFYAPFPPTPEETAAALAQEFPALQTRVLQLVNEQREHAGLPPLAWHPGLARAATAHATNMAQRQLLAHTIPGIEQHSLTMRAVHAGYEFTRISENIASGQRSAEEVVAAWLASPGHRANILDPAVRETAVGVTLAANGALYFCQVYGVQHAYAGH